MGKLKPRARAGAAVAAQRRQRRRGRPRLKFWFNLTAQIPQRDKRIERITEILSAHNLTQL